MADTRHVFTYGSLMFPAVWQRVVEGAYESREATVHGFQRLRIHGEHYPALIVNPNAGPLAGRVYFDVSASDIARLDHFESSHYARVSVAVTVAGAGAVTGADSAEKTTLAADAYLTLSADALEPVEWSPERFAREGLESFLATYVAANTQPRNLSD